MIKLRSLEWKDYLGLSRRVLSVITSKREEVGDLKRRWQLDHRGRDRSDALCKIQEPLGARQGNRFPPAASRMNQFCQHSGCGSVRLLPDF